MSSKRNLTLILGIIPWTIKRIKKNCSEKIMTVWLLSVSNNKRKFEVAKIGNHYFTYEKLFIPRELIKETNKLIAYFIVIIQFNTDKLYKV